MFLKFFKPSFILNLILFISFSISVNSFVVLSNLNIIFYILFHLTLIYLIFYHYHYIIYIIALFYGILFDTLLLNSIGSHLFCFITLITLFIFFKKYLFLLSSYQISITILVTLIITLYSELLFAFMFNNIYFTFSQMIRYLIISIIIFFPSIFLFNKFDK